MYSFIRQHVCDVYRTTSSSQASRLKTLESENASLRDQVTLMNESLSVISKEREELRSMNEQSSTQLRKALEVYTYPITNPP